MTNGEMFDLVHETATANELELAKMSVTPMGYHFEFIRTSDPAAHLKTRRQGWALNHGDIAAQKDFHEYVRGSVAEIAKKMTALPPLASIPRKPKS